MAILERMAGLYRGQACVGDGALPCQAGRSPATRQEVPPDAD
jgi:hypothetical protein